MENELLEKKRAQRMEWLAQGWKKGWAHGAEENDVEKWMEE